MRMRTALAAVPLLALLLATQSPVARAGELKLKAFPDTPITGSLEADDPAYPVVRFSAFGKTANIPREWIASVKPNEEALAVPDVTDEQDAAQWCNAGEAHLRRGDERKAKPAFEKAFALAPTLDAARRGWLRYELEDIIKANLRKRDKLGEMVAPYSGCGPVVAEYAAWYTVAMALFLVAARDGLGKQMRRILDGERAKYLALVAKNARGEHYSEKDAAVLAEGLARITRMWAEPWNALDVMRLRDRPEERYGLFADMAAAMKDEAATAAVVRQAAAPDGLLASTFPVTAVGKPAGDEVAVANDATREANKELAKDLSDREREYLAAVNDYRELLGLHRLRIDAMLQKAAVRHTNDMAGRNVLSHTGSDGSSPGKRAADAGFPISKAITAENVQRSATSDSPISDVLRNWQESCGHHSNMLRSDLRLTGVAAKECYWTQVFASEPLQR
ncbi:MAG: CAP domain-containing protein [Planctomycetota bacterium]